MFLTKKYNHLLLDLFVKIKMTIFFFFFFKKPHISKILVFFYIYIDRLRRSERGLKPNPKYFGMSTTRK